MSLDTQETLGFNELNLSQPILQALEDVGYEKPSPIQAKIIPKLLEGRDVVGQAQTGTGKTAAFALPILSGIALDQEHPQAVVLTPTRELAIQVAEAFQRYAAHMRNLRVLPIYGGQSFTPQLRQLKRGAHVVVGTPGRMMDHLRRGTLNLDHIRWIVLDEADEMLRMGFVDDVEWILKQTPKQRQTALFSATMPKPIRRIAENYLKDPAEVTIEVRTTTAETIRQRYWMVSGLHKLDALTRILEVEPFDGMIVFVRTKTATVQLAEKLQARGFSAAALNGDIAQNQRERTVNQLKNGELDILVATDVAARGLDVDRISHVINYDIPYDTEAYVHRIGRTGRAGREGEAILFVAPRERRMLASIEKATHQRIALMELPSTARVNDSRIQKFHQTIDEALGKGDLGFYQGLIEDYLQQHNVPAIEIAAALALQIQGDEPFLLKDPPKGARDGKKKHGERRTQLDGLKGRIRNEDMACFRIEVGRTHGVMPGNIVGAIANEMGLDAKFIGRIDLFDAYSTVDLPKVLTEEVLKTLANVKIAGQKLSITKSRRVPKSFRKTKPRTKFKPKTRGKSKKRKPKS